MEATQVRRLSLPADFRRAYGKGDVVRHRLIVLHYVPNGLAMSRIGFSVSKKIGNAVVRNRTKRRLREGTGQHSQRLGSGYDLVFSARVPCRDAAYQDIVRAISEVLTEARLIDADGRARRGGAT